MKILILLLVSVFYVGIFYFFKKEWSESKRAFPTEISQAFHDILKYGRLAQNCRKIEGKHLLCEVDLHNPPLNQKFTKVKFRLSQNPSECDGNSSCLIKEEALFGSSQSTIKIYRHISEFVVCDDNDMVSPKGCVIRSHDISTQHAKNLDTSLNPEEKTEANRFFMFQLTDNSQAPSLTLHSAFFVRHPLNYPQVAYEWH